MDILTDLNRRLHALRDHEVLTVSRADLTAWRDKIAALEQFAPKQLPFPMSLFTCRKRQIVMAIHKAGARGLTSEELFEAVYKDDEDGGPETGVKIIATHIFGINRKLKPHGVHVRHTQPGGRGARAGTYVLEPIK